MSKKYLPSKEGSWLDKQNSPYTEEKHPICHHIDGMKRCIDSDSNFDFESIDAIEETGKNKEIVQIQKFTRTIILRKKNVKMTQIHNRKIKNRGTDEQL